MMPIGRVKKSADLELGFLRGKQAGIFKAYKDLKKKFPQAAQYLLNCNQMNKRGEIEI